MKKIENILPVLRGDADAVVGKTVDDPRSLRLTGNIKAQRTPGIAVFDGVVDEVGEYLT